jgi:hypothetical protein
LTDKTAIGSDKEKWPSGIKDLAPVCVRAAVDRLPRWESHGKNTHRRFEVGADATDARTERPGSEGPREVENAPITPVPSSGLFSRELEASSGSVVEYCEDADEVPGAASVTDWLSTDEEEWL